MCGLADGWQWLRRSGDDINRQIDFLDSGFIWPAIFSDSRDQMSSGNRVWN